MNWLLFQTQHLIFYVYVNDYRNAFREGWRIIGLAKMDPATILGFLSSNVSTCKQMTHGDPKWHVVWWRNIDAIESDPKLQTNLKHASLCSLFSIIQLSLRNIPIFEYYVLNFYMLLMRLNKKLYKSNAQQNITTAWGWSRTRTYRYYLSIRDKILLASLLFIWVK